MPNSLIEIGGEKRPVNFGRNFWAEVETLSGKTTSDIFKNFASEIGSFKSQVIITYSALKWGLYDDDKGTEPNPKFTQYKVAGWIDANPDVMDEVLKALTISLPTKKKVEESEVK